MRSSYKEEDVILLLKDISGLVEPQGTKEREKLIQAGRHYCEMLPIEYVPSQKYMEAYKEALKYNARQTALAVGNLADKIIQRRGRDVVLVSLARAGIPIGILLKRYIKQKFDIDVMHYSISIIRGKGIDQNAVDFILNEQEAKNILFVDGWTGKGAIFNQLSKAVKQWENLSSELAVLADPAHLTDLCGTHDDILIPSSCLNCTVSGLISRTFLRDDIIGKDDFHGAVFYENLKDSDLSYEFIEQIQSRFWKEAASKQTDVTYDDAFGRENPGHKERQALTGLEEVRQIAADYKIKDINLVKPGIGETTRVLLRRVPWKVLISQSCKDDRSLHHIIRLAKEKNAEVIYYPLNNYKACGIIKKMADT